LRLNEWALSGEWDRLKNQAVMLNKPNGRSRYRFRARDLHLVMGPRRPGNIGAIRVLIDAAAPRRARK